MLDLPRFLRDAERFCQASARQQYMVGAGLVASPDLTTLYDDFGHLFRDDTYGELLEADLPARQRQLLQVFVAAGYFGERTARLSDQLGARQAAAVVPWDDQALPWRVWPIALSNEPDPLRRHALAAAGDAVLDGLNALYEERHRALVENASKLGADYLALWDDVLGLQLADLQQAARHYLDATERQWFEALDDLLTTTGVVRPDASPCDLAWLFRGRAYDTTFGSRALVPTLYCATRDLGLDLEAQSAIYLDREPRPLKLPDAFCAALQVPDDVRGVLAPHGGRLDYGALWWLAGPAEYWASVDRTQPFALRWVADGAVLESYGLLFASLLAEPAWLDRYLDLDQSLDLVRVARLERLYLARRAATGVLWEAILHAGGDYATLAQRYAELFTRELGVEHAPAGFLADSGDHVAAAQRFRAWIFEAQLRAWLVREYDAEWYRLPRAGRFLRDLWREGGKYSVESLARDLGYSGLDLRPLTAELVAGVA